MNTVELWKQRFQLFLKELRTYGKYVFNDHLKFAVIFAIGVGAYYYQQWLATLTPSFPAVFVIAVLFSLVLTAGSIHTLLKPADLVFLLPLEEKMKPYFFRAFRFTYIIQLYVLGMMGAALAPLYLQQLQQPVSVYIWIFVMLAIVKVWNLLAAWEIIYSMDDKKRVYDRIVRFGLNFLLVYFLAGRYSIIYTAGVVVAMALYWFLLQKREGKRGLNWEQLIAEEGKKMLLFYRIANLFTDVPVLKERVKRRKWLDGFASLVPFAQKNTYSFLYIRTFLRSGGYFGVYVRLLALGGVLIYVIPFLYGRLFISSVFLYFIGYQLLSLWKHHRLKLWMNLYPIAEEEKKRSFLSLHFRFLFAGGLVFCITFLFATMAWGMALLLAGGNIVFSYVFTYGYCSRKIEALL
ncbi:MAG: ABC transporter permease [Ectobacillus sp.]